MNDKTSKQYVFNISYRFCLVLNFVFICLSLLKAIDFETSFIELVVLLVIDVVLFALFLFLHRKKYLKYLTNNI